MKKVITLALMAFSMLYFAACEDDSDAPQPEEQDQYTVEYKTSMSGEYEDLKITYFETGSQVKEINSINDSWEKSFDNFSAGDSVVFILDFKTVAQQTVSYDCSISVSKNGSLLTDTEGSNSLTPNDTVFMIRRAWRYKIPE